jgi:hypothetical protein
MSLAAQNRTRPRRTIEVLKMALLVLAAVLSAPLARAGQGHLPNPLQGDGRVSDFYRWDAAIPGPGKLLRQEELEPTLGLANAGAQFRILYSSTDGVDGKAPNVVSGLLFLPRGGPPVGGGPSWLGHMRRPEWLTSARPPGSAIRQRSRAFSTLGSRMA